MNKYGNFIRGLTAFCLVMLCIGPAISQTGGSGPTDEVGQPKWAAAWGAAMYKHTWSRLPEPMLQGRTTLLVRPQLYNTIQLATGTENFR